MPDCAQEGSAHHKHRQMVLFTYIQHCLNQFQLTEL